VIDKVIAHKANATIEGVLRRVVRPPETTDKVPTAKTQDAPQGIARVEAKVAVLLVATHADLDAVQMEIGTTDPEIAKATIDNPIETKHHRSHESKSIAPSKRNPFLKPCNKGKNHCVPSPT
jgi:hypothetical protein